MGIYKSTVYKSNGQLKSNIYLDPKHIQDCFDESIKEGKCTNRLLDCFQKIAENFITKYNNVNDEDRRACINYAVAEAWQKWNKYDKERSQNVFAFYTTMISNDLRIHYNYINRHNSAKISIDSLTSEER